MTWHFVVAALGGGLLHEPPGVRLGISCVLILGGIGLVVRARHHR
jgi:drug/metabolite transporter (DMT)-like permease